MEDLSGLIVSESQRYIEGLNGKDVEFQQRLTEAVNKVIWANSQHIPETQPIAVVEREGKMGVLPPPAKKINAKEALLGQRPSPLKVYEEELPIGKPRQEVDTVFLPIILPVTPFSISNPREIYNALNTLFGIGNMTRQKDLILEREAVHKLMSIKKIQAIVFLLKEGALGNSSLMEFGVSTSGAMEDARRFYQESLAGVLTFNPEEDPNVEFLADEENYRKIANSVTELNKSGKNIIVPTAVNLSGRHSFEPIFYKLFWQSGCFMDVAFVDVLTTGREVRRQYPTAGIFKPDEWGSLRVSELK